MDIFREFFGAKPNFRRRKRAKKTSVFGDDALFFERKSAKIYATL